MKLETLEEIKEYANICYHSGALGSKDNQTVAVAKAVVAIQYGGELGMTPMQSIKEVQFISGKPTLSASGHALLLKKHGRHSYEVAQHTETLCSIVYSKDGEEIGISSFDTDDANRAGLTRNPMWSKFAKAMLFARAMTQGCRWYCADVFGGSTYTPDELDEQQAPEAEPLERLKGLMEAHEEPG